MFMLSVQAAAAEEARFYVEGEKLFYNSNVPYLGETGTDIVERDVDELGLYLMEAPDVTTVVLESWGGSSSAAMAMGRKILDLSLATEVRHGCESACAYAFLAGRPRTLVAGGQLGFHRGSTKTTYVRDFVSAVVDVVDPVVAAYDQSITAAVDTMRYMLEHGVTETFILEVLATPPREMLRPNREELVAAGVIDAD